MKILLKNPQTNWKFILIVTTLAFLVSGGIFYYTKDFIRELNFLSKFPELKVPEKVIKDETANWKTYRNEKYGFEIKYPAVFAFEENRLPSEKEDDIEILQVLSYEQKESDLSYGRMDITIQVFTKPFDQYKFIGTPQGAIFRFDIKNKQWVYDKNGVSELFLPERANVPLEAYITGFTDILCSLTGMIIPHPSYSFVVLIDSTYCIGPDGAPASFFGLQALQPEQILSTFRFLE